MIPMLTGRTAADGSETWMQLKDKALLRRAMDDSAFRAAQGVGRDCSSIPKLALAAGLSTAAVGFLVSEGRSGRSSCKVRTAEAIAEALGWPVDLLFVTQHKAAAA